ncbi:MAG TPA: ABC transporter permease [Chloroflexi bacterium]|nr:ABC transporter permease [Chloroflexota bacterium]HBY08777.1 ABC transporter permease [Chloroflexota bacterium]
MQSTKKLSWKSHKNWIGENRYWGLWLISPWLLGLLLFKLVPIVGSFALSLTNMFLLEPDQAQFVGLKNYIDTFRDPNVGVVFITTVKLALILVPLQTGFSILIATLLSNKKLLMKNSMRALFFIPSIIPSAANVYMWRGFVNPTTGWLNRLILDPLGLERLNIFAGRGAGQALFILSMLWTIGPSILINMGAIQSIPSELHEAAKIDGAGYWRRWWAITLPLITPAIFFTLILNLTAVFSGALILDRGYNHNSGLSSYDQYIYFMLFRAFKLGAASSLAWVFFVFVMLVVLVLFITSKRWVYFPEAEDQA